MKSTVLLFLCRSFRRMKVKRRDKGGKRRNSNRCFSLPESVTPTEMSQSQMFSSLTEYLPDENHANSLFTGSFHSALRKTSSSSIRSLIHLCDTCQTVVCSHCRPMCARPIDSQPPFRTGSSSHSIESADSAFCDQRLAELNETTTQSSNIHETLL